MQKQESEVNLGGGANLVMNTSRLVTCHEILTLIVNGKKAIDLNIQVQADFDTIPEAYHEVFLNMMAAKYCKAVSFGDNPFSQCHTTRKKRWYQFWK